MAWDVSQNSFISNSVTFLGLTALRSCPLSVNLRARFSFTCFLTFTELADLPAWHLCDKESLFVYCKRIVFFYYFYHFGTTILFIRSCNRLAGLCWLFLWGLLGWFSDSRKGFLATILRPFTLAAVSSETCNCKASCPWLVGLRDWAATISVPLSASGTGLWRI